MTKELTPVPSATTLAAIKAITDAKAATTTSSDVAAVTAQNTDLADLQAQGTHIQYAVVAAAENTVDSSATPNSHLYQLELANQKTVLVDSNVELTPGQRIAFQVTNNQLRLIAVTQTSEVDMVRQLIHQLSTQQNSPVEAISLLLAANQIASDIPFAASLLNEQAGIAQTTTSTAKALNTLNEKPTGALNEQPAFTPSEQAVKVLKEQPIAALLKQFPVIQEIAEAISKQVPEFAQLTKTDTVKNAISNSGLFFESKLQSVPATEIATTDIKALFTKLNAAFNYNSELKGKVNTTERALNVRSNAATEKSSPNNIKSANALKLTSTTREAPPSELVELAEPSTPAATLSAFARAGASLYASAAKQASPVLLPQVPPPLPGMPSMHFHPHMNLRNATDLGAAFISVLFRNTQASLNRITLQQLSSESKSEDNEQGDALLAGIKLNFDIPFIWQQSTHALNIRIEGEPEQQTKEENNKKQKVSIWNVTLAFDLDSLGPIQVQLRINDTLANATIWSERAQTLAATRVAADNLKASLTNIGLNVSSIDCKPGIPATKNTPVEHRLVDVKT